MGASRQPSNSADVTSALDDLLIIITGSAEKEEHMLKQISSKLNKSSLGKIVSEAAAPQIEFLSATANMLTAIAGYLYGEKGINLKTPASQLLGKIKNNSPILGDKSMQEIIIDSDAAAENDYSGGSASLDLLIELKGITGNDLQALREVIETLVKAEGLGQYSDLKVIEQSISVLEYITKNLGKVDFSVFNKKFANSVASYNSVIKAVCESNIILLKNLPAILLINIFKTAVLEFPKILAYFVSGNNGKGGLVMVKNHIEKAKLKPKDITKFFTEVVNILKVFVKVGFLSLLTCIFNKSIKNTIKTLVDSVNEFENIDNKKVKTNIKTAKDVATLVKSMRSIFSDLIVVGMVSLIAKMFIKAIPKSISILKSIVDAFKGINIKAAVKNTKDIKKLSEFIKALRNIFVGLAIIAIVALPALIGLFIIKIAVKLLFKVIDIVTTGLSKSKDLKASLDNLKGLSIFILTIGLLMVFAALVGGWVIQNVGNILGFAGILMLFITALLLPFVLFSKFFTEAMKSAAQIAILIGVCALVMMLGAVFMLSGLVGEALLFGLALAGFIFIVLIPFVLLGGFLPKAMESAKDIMILVVGCALVMMIGALFMLTGLWKEALGFGLILAVFIAGVMLPFIFFAYFAADISKSVKAITSLIITCALILVLGALFMLTGLWVEAIGFAVILTVFIWLVSLPFLLWGRKLTKAAPAIFAIALLVVVSTIVLMIGANFIRDYGALDIILFATILLGFVGILAIMCNKLGEGDNQKNIMKGAGIMAILLGIVMLGSLAMGLMAKAASIADPVQVLATVGILTLIILAIAGISIGLGFLSDFPATAPFFWAGIGAMAAIAAIAVLISTSILIIAKAVQVIAEVAKDGPIDISGVTTVLGVIPVIGSTIASAGMSILPLMPIIALTSITTLGMAKMISELGKSVADIANLRVAEEYDAKGKPTKYIQLSEKHFTMAANGVSSIITTIGAAIGKVYKEHRELFGIFSPVTKVIDAATSMAKMISKLGKSVAEISNLKVAEKWDNKGNPIKYLQLNTGHFEMAGKNVGLIVNMLGLALKEEYNRNGDLYKKPLKFSLFGGIRQDTKAESPIERVVNTATKMGTMMSKLAKGVKDMATMQVADRWDKNGNPIHYVRLSDSDILMAGVNTGLIVSMLGVSLAKEYKRNKIMYEKPLKITLFGAKADNDAETPLERVINTATGLGTMMSKLAKGVSDFAGMKIAKKWDKNGNPIAYEILTPEKIEKAGNNVGDIVKILAESLINLYKTHPDYFENFWGNASKSPIAKVIKSTEGLGELIADVAKGIKDIADLSFKDANGKVIKINDTDLGVGGVIYNRIKSIFTTFSGSIISISADTSFKDFEKNVKDIKKSFPTAIDLITDAAESYKDIEKSLKDIDTVKVSEKWNGFITGIFTKFNSEITPESINNFKTLSETDFKKFDFLIKSVNALNDAKVDKFIELSNELRELSLSVGDIGGLVDALNGRINETLTNLADKLEDASISIKESDKAQEKRQKLIEKNTKKLERVLDKPMKVELSKAASSGSGGGGSKSGGGSSSSSSVTAPGGGGGNGGIKINAEDFNSAVTRLTTWLDKQGV